MVNTKIKVTILMLLSFIMGSVFSVLFYGCGSSSSNDVASTDVGNPDVATEIAGAAQKGPFLQYTQIFIYELDEYFDQTGTSFQTETLNDMGDFTLPVNLTSPYVLLLAHEGNFYDEISDDITTGMTLSAIADATGNNAININILTTLAKSRVLELIEDGASFEDANEQARFEILDIFDIYDPDATPFEDMDILEHGDSNAMLLAVSVILMQAAHNENSGVLIATFEEIIGDIRDDIQYDGILDNTVIKGLINDARISLHIPQIRNNLENQYPDATIPKFKKYVAGNVHVQWDMNCGMSDVSTVEAKIYTSADDPSDPTFNEEWACELQEGTRENINSGAYESIVISFKDAEGKELFFYKESGFTIPAGQTIDIQTDSVAITNPAYNS